MTRARLAPLLVATAGALYFGLTAARDLQPFDSTEFALNAVQFGVGHPPGQPLYLLLSAAAVRLLGFLSPSHALAWLSIAATVAAAAWALVFALRRQPAAQPSSRGKLTLVVAAGLGPFLLPGVWDMATRAEVYPLAGLLVAGAAFVALQHDVQHEVVAVDAAMHKRFAIIGALLGLGASVNPAIALAGGVALAPLLLSRLVAAGLRRGLIGLAVLVAVGIVGLLPYALLPVIGAHPRDALVWGEPLQGDALAFFLLGRDYRTWHVAGPELLHNLVAALAWLQMEGILPWLVLGSLGFALAPLPRASKVVLPLGAGAAAALLALNHPFIPSNPDYDGYLLPWIWLASAGVVLLAVRLAVTTARGLTLALVAVAALWFVGGATAPSLSSRNRRPGGLTEILAGAALRDAPPAAVLLLQSDHLVFGALYLQQVKALRPDVTVVNLGWANSSWYWRWLQRRDPRLPLPQLKAPSREARVAAWLAEAKRPVAAESLRLAALAGPACMKGQLAIVAEWCAPGVDAVFASVPAIQESAPQRMEMLARALSRPEGLDQRLLCSTAAGLAEDYARLGDAGQAFLILRAALHETRLLDGLPGGLPAGRRATVTTRLTEPRALLPPGALLLRMGDLLASVDPQGALEYYRRADLPESEGAIARLLDGNTKKAQGGTKSADVAPGVD